jgi:uncharacterized protein YkwD
MIRTPHTRTDVSRTPEAGRRVGRGRREFRLFGIRVPVPGTSWLVVARKGAYLTSLVAVASVAFALQPLPAVSAPAGAHVFLTSLESNVLSQLNEVRVEHGLSPLRLSRSLTAAANQHCVEMVADGFFDHPSANGSQFSARIRQYYDSSGLKTWSVGENLLWTAGSPRAVHVVDMWMASPEHRANLLSPTWREIGISVVSSANAPGVFENRRVTVVATDFGSRG